MKLIYLVLSVIVCLQSNTCEIKSQKEIVILSPALAHHLNQMGLFSSKKITHLGQFINLHNEEKEIIKGGIYISKKSLIPIKSKLVFFDKSIDLKKKLNSSIPSSHLIELDTRNLDPLEAILYLHKNFKGYTNNCEKKFFAKFNALVASFAKSKAINKTYFFFLGQIKQDKLPSLLMTNDGPVILLKKILGIKTYKSELAYTTLSQKTYNQMKGAIIHIGISSSERENKIQKISESHFNIKRKDGLIPGWPQAKLAKDLIKLVKGIDKE